MSEEERALLDGIAERIYEAVGTLRRLPDRESGWLSSHRRGAWPQIIVGYWEAYGMHRARVRLPPPSAAKIEDMERVLQWLTWLGRLDRLTMHCVFVCAGRGLEPSQASDILGLHRNTIRLKRDDGLRRILNRFVKPGFDQSAKSAL